MLDRLLALWCRLAHRGDMTPIHGRVQCRVCHRVRRVDWQREWPAKVEVRP